MSEAKNQIAQLMGQVEAHGILLAAMAGALNDNPVFKQALRVTYETQMKLMQLEGRSEALQPHVQATLKHLLMKSQLPF